jgi:hypothetical protein
MAASILQQKRIGNTQVYYLAGCHFSKNGSKFQVIGSESTGPAMYDVVHTINNLLTGTYAYIAMPKLIQILQDSE